MKKNLTGFILFLLSCQLGMSQSRENKGFEEAKSLYTLTDARFRFSFKIGPTIPVGEFGEIDFNNKKQDWQKQVFN